MARGDGEIVFPVAGWPSERRDKYAVVVDVSEIIPNKRHRIVTANETPH
uniref:Uncharacterized protein n=1 Tax=Candidatus Kentrum sp. DK TaxID=2126562 RepID=A0A450SWC1_9GAMM|nr:MAG: hypothetical protein BECKDK2373C_GA0170839_106414 [Candidatus Kentron sp. DK]